MKYLLTIQHEYEADDDPAARNKAKFLIANADFWTAAVESKPEIKLRCIYDNKPPRTLNLNPAVTRCEHCSYHHDKGICTIVTDNADKIVDCDGLDVRCPEYLKAAPWLKEPPLKVRTIDVVKTHPLQCCYCRIEDKTVEAGGIWYCPNPLCSGPGGHWFRCDLDSYALIDIDKHTVNQEEWEARANEYLSARPELYRKVRKL